MTEAIAILRRCRRCNVYQSIDGFTELGKVCRRCIKGKTPSGSLGIIRGLVITDSGRELLEEWRAAERVKEVA